MCGIWSLINLKSAFGDLSPYFSDFIRLINRGPDDTRIEVFGNNVMVGFHRLAIMDLSTNSNQPYVLEDGNRKIIFLCNGEIYNYQELNEQYDLGIEGHKDCLVIPELYLQLTDGEDDFQEWVNLFGLDIKGEFAFIMLEYQDNVLKYVISGRDQIGIRPLYYSVNDDNILFTSEIKGANNYEGEVKEFKPGSVLVYKLDESEDLVYRTYSFRWLYRVKERNLLDEEHIEEIKTSVINSVRRRLHADRPIAFLLSGGVDSSLVASIASREFDEPINTFCCGMRGATDFEYARKVAEHIGSNHTEVYFTEQEGLGAIRDVIYATETWDTTTIRASVGQYMVSKYISENTDYKVVLVGEGPDEVCSSYLFNWYAPTGDKLDRSSKEYVKNIHMYDVKRCDRCISHFGLEGRVPLLDPEFISAYWTLPSDKRHPKYNNIEKYWLRQAFVDGDYLPMEVLWRTKEAFSDGVSSKTRSWYQIIQDWCSEYVMDSEMKNNGFEYYKPITKEAYYFRKVFREHFGDNRDKIIPKYWLPKWDSFGNEISGYIDPSARILNLYS